MDRVIRLTTRVSPEIEMKGLYAMKAISFVVCTLVAVLAVSPAPAGEAPDAAPVAGPLPAIPNTPAAVEGLVYASKFTLEEGFTYYWFNAGTGEGCQERLTVDSGWLLVLKVDPKFVAPRQLAQPVLYVGDMTAERLNIGYRSGHVVAIVPGDVDLKTAPIYFGTPDLPERVDSEKAAAELNNATAAEIRPFSDDAVESANRRGGDTRSFQNKAEMLQLVVDLLKQYSPMEKELIATLVPTPVSAD